MRTITPRFSGIPPTANAFPRSDGSCCSSTAQKKASRSKWIILRIISTPVIESHRIFTCASVVFFGNQQYQTEGYHDDTQCDLEFLSHHYSLNDFILQNQTYAATIRGLRRKAMIDPGPLVHSIWLCAGPVCYQVRAAGAGVFWWV